MEVCMVDDGVAQWCASRSRSRRPKLRHASASRGFGEAMARVWDLWFLGGKHELYAWRHSGKHASVRSHFGEPEP